MKGESLSLVSYILEKEAREKARKRKKQALIIGGTVFGIVALVVPFLLRDPSPYREFAAADLTLSQVISLLEADPSPLIVKDDTYQRVDTIRSAEEYAFLLTAIHDSKSPIPMQESGEVGNSEGESYQPLTVDPAQVQAVSLTEPLTEADIMPSYPGGEAALYQFLSSQIRYPPEALQTQVEGKVFVRFVIGNDGAISQVKVVKGIGYGCDEEAIRVVKMMPHWIPGEEKGQKVPVYSSLAVNFKFL
ncbi:MAG: energy transducer TonB [Bacteroidota bacterium]